MSNKRNKKNVSRKRKAEDHKAFLLGLKDKYEQPVIQKQRLLPGSLYLNWYLNERGKEEDGNVSSD